ncbi:TPA: hypothetical protein ACWL50_000079 [Staphylococcus aureus]
MCQYLCLKVDALTVRLHN